MAEYNYTEIEKKWQKYWLEHKTFKTENGGGKKKFYCLDMFPYPSGAGLHVGHPEGYTATDILCRYKRMKGFNVLHPMGWDAFGLPAEQYAVETGTHPAVTTKKNVDRFREQIRAGHAPRRHHEEERGPLPRADSRARLLVRLGPRGEHHRPEVLQVDAVDLRAAL